MGGNKRTKANEEDPAFAEWYAAYPVHKARGAAVKAYAKALDKPGVTPEVLLDAAKRYRDEPQVKRGYGKHPATWLNNDCWLDEPTPLAAKAASTIGTDRGGATADVNDRWTKETEIRL